MHENEHGQDIGAKHFHVNGDAERLVLTQVGDMVKRHSKMNYIIYCKSFAKELTVLFYQTV